MKAVLYHEASGRIEAELTAGNLDDFHPFVSGEMAILGLEEGMDVDADLHYVADNQITERTNAVLTVSATMAAPGEIVTVSGLPDPCFLCVLNEVVEVTGGTYEFTREERGNALIEFAGQHKGEAVLVRFSEFEKMKANAKIKIDAEAEAARSRVVTPGSGQAMTYMRKADAARAFLDGATLSEAQMARLTDEAARLGVEVAVAAQAIVDIADAWEGLDAGIDNLRLISKSAIDAAANAVEVEGILNGIVWPC